MHKHSLMNPGSGQALLLCRGRVRIIFDKMFLVLTLVRSVQNWLWIRLSQDFLYNFLKKCSSWAPPENFWTKISWVGLRIWGQLTCGQGSRATSCPADRHSVSLAPMPRGWETSHQGPLFNYLSIYLSSFVYLSSIYLVLFNRRITKRKRSKKGRERGGDGENRRRKKEEKKQSQEGN